MTTRRTKTGSKILAMPLIAVLLTMVVAAVMPQAYADTVDCSTGGHCYSDVKKSTDNRGGSATIYINSENYVEANRAIANPLWIVFDNGDWIEGGWEKGYIQPCSSTSAKFYWFETVGRTTSECIGSVSGSTMTVLITDSDLSDTYLIYVNGKYEKSVVNTDDAVRMAVGGESTDEDNELDNGRDRYLKIIYPSGTTYSWGGSNLSYSSKTADYTHSWNSQYTDFAYEGPPP